MTIAKWGEKYIKKKKYIKRCVLGISLIYKAKLKRILVGYLVKTFIKGGRRQPIKLNNKGGKHLMSSSLGVRPLYWRSCNLKRVGPRLCGSYNLYTIRLECYRGLALI